MPRINDPLGISIIEAYFPLVDGSSPQDLSNIYILIAMRRRHVNPGGVHNAFGTIRNDIEPKVTDIDIVYLGALKCLGRSPMSTTYV